MDYRTLNERCRNELNGAEIWDMVKEHVYPLVLPYEKNKKALEKVVFYRFLDLAICFYVRVPITAEVVRIDKSTIMGWNITKEMLQVQAKENLQRDGYEMYTINQLKRRREGEVLWNGFETEMPMLVLTNPYGSYGAAAILDDSMLEGQAAEYKTNLFLLPANIHEVIVLPDFGYFSVEELRAVVGECNLENVLEREWLSNEIYYYDRLQHRVRRAV